MQNDVYEVSVAQSLLGQLFINTVHVREAVTTLSDAGRFTALLEVANDFKNMLRTNQYNTLIYTGWRATQVLGSGVTWSQVNCKKSGGQVIEGSFTLTLNGAEAGGAPTPTFAALVLKEGTGFAGRARRGRVHIGGISTVFYQGTGSWNPAAITNMGTAITTFRGFHGPVNTTASFEVVVFSKRLASGCAPGATHPHILQYRGDQDLANAYKSVQSITASPLIGTMVRRKVGVGV